MKSNDDSKNLVLTSCNFTFLPGKSGKSHKPKSKSSSGASGEIPEASASKKSKKPRTNQLFDVGSEDEDIGQETTLGNCSMIFAIRSMSEMNFQLT